MITDTTHTNLLSVTQFQPGSSNRINTPNESSQISSENNREAQTVNISQEAKRLQREFDNDKSALDDRYTQETRALEREYQLEKNQLEREFSRKKRSLEINIYA